MFKCQKCKKHFGPNHEPITGIIGGVNLTLCYSCGVDVNNYIIHSEETIVYKTLTPEQKKEAESFYLHLINHMEVQKATDHTGIPVCKICDKSSKEICEEYENGKRNEE